MRGILGHCAADLRSQYEIVSLGLYRCPRSTRRQYARELTEPDRLGTEDQESVMTMPPPSSLVDEAAQRLKQLRGAVNLVENDEARMPPPPRG